MLVNKVDMFYFEILDEKKSDIIKKFQDGDSEIKVVIVILFLEWVQILLIVILYGILFLIINLVQEVGRVGGDDKEFIVLLLYNEYYL